MTVAFDFQFHSEDLTDDTELREEAERHLLDLAENHKDMIGASVAIEELSHGHTQHVWQARIVAFARPSNLAAVDKADTARGALQGALRAIEKQIRKRRDELGRPWEKPSNQPQSAGEEE